jgi:4-hydroxythreonine-4-phosphate dehydrogenase
MGKFGAELFKEIRHPPPLAVTMGDPAGVGLDITLEAWCERRRLGLPTFFLLADPEALSDRARQLRLSVAIEEVSNGVEAESRFASALPVRPVRLVEPVTAGAPNAANAAAIIDAVRQGVDAVVKGEASAIVTNPIAKNVLWAAGFPHPGHTEYLAALADEMAPDQGARAVMMLVAEEIRVVPLTVHIPLAHVSSAVSEQLICETAAITAAALRRDFAIAAPRIAICGLNPHAGEGGALGAEESRIISPAIDRLQADGLNVSGPYPADTLFHAEARQAYDVAIAMYHDQALIPVKTLAFDRAVNVTLGLPFVRTSPDHGTAFDVAGSGHARSASFIAALLLANAIARRRART